MTTEVNGGMVISKLKAFGQELVVACDGKCHKAWGHCNRPQITFNEEDDDDIAYLADDELGTAPDDPGTYEGGHGKPPKPIHNKWRFRECERSESCKISEFPNIKLPDFSQRRYNQPWKHADAAQFD